MKVNWFTVIAQVINFLILVWLLKKFLYKPVLTAIDEREKKIVARLKDAKNTKEEAKKEQDEFVEKNKQFDTNKKKLMDEAIAETNTKKATLMEAARKEVDALQAKQQQAIANTQEALNTELAQKTQQEVFAISRKALTDLASVDLDEQIVTHFINRLAQLKEEEKQQFRQAFKSASRPILIQSAFELPTKQQTDIKNAADEILGTASEFEFTTSPEVISGIELNANGYKLSWTISGYLNSLQSSISEILTDSAAIVPSTKKTHSKKQETSKETA